MRYSIGVLLICSLFSIAGTENVSNQSLADSMQDDAPSNMLISQVRRERKERRLLRKKKQKLRELREEIRALTMSLHQMRTLRVHISLTEYKWQEILPDDEHSTETEAKRKKKDRRDHKGVKWRKNLLDKLKIIVRRLDRMERRIINVKSFLPFDVTNTTLVFTGLSTSTAFSTASNDTFSSKIKRIQPAITRSRSGENGTACVAHKDCRPD
ncbi:hypothetical protein OESDEN_09952 [Oesophagostomum dentatum]|uniref:Uncharacterized protein n=1 Tax=Oesophagostomum dentatum TaxID=61180 RepID=A0A0B1T351_OESDE|nr:hypothetical protein OESDEN_09952 [Oesophagostomum dentatum]